MATYFWIGLGSAIGGMGRFWLSQAMTHRLGDAFPFGTLIVNVSGSFLIGLIAALSPDLVPPRIIPAVRDFLMIGILGGYTTFAAFSVQTLHLAQRGEWIFAAANICLSVTLCLAAVWCGYFLGQMFVART
ncbi:MAG: fluoride efflux transporter CrcB [Verrucomicrobia bacterium]|nr:fluoride efflux transporter CrcB [Verrucomicrobiota bacterium]